MKKSIQAMFLFITAAFLVSCASTPIKPDTEITAEKNTAAKAIPINNPLPKGTLELIDGFEEENFWYALGETKSDDYSTDTDTTEEWSTQGDFCAQWSFAKIPQNEKASFTIENLALVGSKSLDCGHKQYLPKSACNSFGNSRRASSYNFKNTGNSPWHRRKYKRLF